ncbi:hypothetical protein ABPG72_011004 [Tetrahymena utriculariae]
MNDRKDVNQLIKQQCVRRIFLLIKRLSHKALLEALVNLSQYSKLNFSKKEKVLQKLSEIVEYKYSINRLKPSYVKINEGVKNFLSQEREKQNKLQKILSKLVNNQRLKLSNFFKKWRFQNQNSLDFFKRTINRQYKQSLLGNLEVFRRIVNFQILKKISTAFNQILLISQNNQNNSRSQQHAEQVARIINILLSNKLKEQKIIAFNQLCKQFVIPNQVEIRQDQNQNQSMQSQQAVSHKQISTQKRSDLQKQIDKAIIKEQALFGQKYQQKTDKTYHKMNQIKPYFSLFTLVNKWKHQNIENAFNLWKQILSKQAKDEKFEYKKILDKVFSEVDELQKKIDQLQPQNNQIPPLEYSQHSNPVLRQTFSQEKLEFQDMMLMQSNGMNSANYQYQNLYPYMMVEEHNPHEQEMEIEENNIYTLEKELFIINMKRKLILSLMENKQKLRLDIQNYYYQERFQQDQNFYSYMMFAIKDKIDKLNYSIQDIQNSEYFDRFRKELFENVKDINSSLYQICRDEDYTPIQIIEYLKQKMDDQINFQNNSQIFMI